MRHLDLTLPTAEENLALDEALLDEAEGSAEPDEVLRLWESPLPLVVVGRSSRLDEEVDLPAARRRGVPVLRRASGGAAVVAGPGCLMYAIVLSYQRRPELRMIDLAHRCVLETLLAGLRPLVDGLSRQGTSDLVWQGRKFSGNSLRCKRRALLYHGTLLYDFPLESLGELLRAPPREPAYRRGRAHGEFVTNLPLSSAALRAALRSAWQAEEPVDGWPRPAVARLVDEKYARAEWNELSPREARGGNAGMRSAK